MDLDHDSAPAHDRFGPRDGPDEKLTSWPSDRYTAGVLYAPQMPSTKAKGDASEVPSGDDDDRREADPPAPPARRPSAMGLTFSLEGSHPALRISATAAAYAPTRAAGGFTWTRRPLAITPPDPVVVRDGLHAVASIGHARWWLYGVRVGARWEVTVTLENASRPGASRVEAEGLHLFQVGFEVTAIGGARIVPRQEAKGAVDADALVFDLLQRDAPVVAIGRSCAAAWRLVDGRWVAATAPAERRSRPKVSLRGHEVFLEGEVAAALDVAGLARTADAAALAAKLDALPRAYERWLVLAAARIEAQAAAGRLSPARTSVARENLAAARRTATRMRAGIAVLSDPSDATARRAFCLSQSAMLLLPRRGPSGAAEVLRWDAWQLAFQLVVLGDLAATSHAHDGVMDVLSVPSREGRWATYLALSTFALFLRRLRASGDDGAGGVSVILRPSGAHLPWHDVAAARRAVRACETLRREALQRGDATLGRAPFSVVVCAGEDAAFEAGRAAAPDLLVGDAAACARALGDGACAPPMRAGGAPVLLVQDKLDLLQGPKGAVAGLFEAVVDLLLAGESGRPKAVGGVAAACGVQPLTRSLFDRTGARFPPPVLDADDTGFVAPDGASGGSSRRPAAGVEPFSPRARDRALRPAMEALARGALARAPRRRSLDATWRARCDGWVDALLDRVGRVCPDERFATSREAEAMLDAWQRRGSVGGEAPETYFEGLWSLVLDGGVSSALAVPPFSLDPTRRFGPYWAMVRDADPKHRPLVVEIASKRLPKPYDVLLRVAEEWAESQVSDPKDEDVRVAEYRQLVRALWEPIERPEFDTRPEPCPAEFGALFEGVALARRLCEVRARSLRRPAIEVRGEGIFLAFHPDAIAAWEDESANPALKAHFDRFAGRVDAWRPYGPRFVMLHSFAHALMRQLSLACGYSSSALRERVYVGDAPTRQMGVLIHTDSPDSEGTLGGLVRQGRRERLRDTLVALLHDARWCSSDPVCITGTMTLSTPRNGAACHACLLAPETSCEHFNTLLDRALLVGTPDAPAVGFFRPWLDENP